MAVKEGASQGFETICDVGVESWATWRPKTPEPTLFHLEKTNPEEQQRLRKRLGIDQA
jgi:hypothetical protein